MAFQNQFALSLELTKLIPLGSDLAVRTADELKKLVKALSVRMFLIFVL
jgi:hypothetical protein